MKTKQVTREWLESQVSNINAELFYSHHEAKERHRLEAARNYYVSKLVEMDEYNLQFIEIEIL
ncbi:hypothetical protein [Capnocytophaga catalasegens]|uniref:Uncharacterized protein n=1 Tax=Capnocytophaga catalasegens TaxID=1004260 RepID=A0AAV5AYX4_9FLAO|nr:hypothetical protein [Capnocytophaga catalasegens]GIZ15277.1 hypothetical protein RCZ03_12770 [Capnocytophaga catalasegens]GJM51211.1 hypothetical protein RCZ15_21840 [Capnocytophaga catalasegens]GJM53005.1 hypothetical protein RCZ16_13220 [Capnocytophaga catalasegens]